MGQLFEAGGRLLAKAAFKAAAILLGNLLVIIIYMGSSNRNGGSSGHEYSGLVHVVLPDILLNVMSVGFQFNLLRLRN